MQKSIEVEYWVVDEGGELAEPEELTDISENVEEEFVPPLFELKTPPCETYGDLRSAFVEQLDRVLRRADELDKHLVPFGTPVNGERIERWPTERGRIQKRVLGTNFDYAKYCAGTHLHFEKRNVVDQLNTLIGLDPALALLNSSPYFRGTRVANGARAYLYRRKCYEKFPKHGQLWEYADTVGEWKRRLDRRYEEFSEAAVEAGIDEETVEAHFTPDDVVWTPVRLRDEMPTVEWRAPDAALPSEILRVAEEMDTVMEQLHHTNVRVGGTTGGVTEDEIVLPEFETLHEYVSEAIRDGLESPDVATYLERMGFDVQGYDPITPKIDGREYVTRSEACELRLDYAEMLRRDVSRLLRN